MIVATQPVYALLEQFMRWLYFLKKQTAGVSDA